MQWPIEYCGNMDKDFVIHVDIDQDHINRGVPKEPEHCPIALSIREYFMDSWEEDIDIEVNSRISLWGNGNTFRAQVTDKSFDFIKSFDDGETVEPTCLSFAFIKEEETEET